MAASQSAVAVSRTPHQSFTSCVRGSFQTLVALSCQNGETPIFSGFEPRGLLSFTIVPLYIADERIGRIHWDLETLAGYWFISDRMKTVLEGLDPEAFTFAKCRVQLPDGSDAPPRWLCDVVRVVDAVDEEKSVVGIKTANDGSKYYSFLGGFNLIFKKEAIGSHRIFRMKYNLLSVICDDKVRLACKAAGFAGLRFEPVWVKPIIRRS